MTERLVRICFESTFFIIVFSLLKKKKNFVFSVKDEMELVYELGL